MLTKTLCVVPQLQFPMTTFDGMAGAIERKNSFRFMVDGLIMTQVTSLDCRNWLMVIVASFSCFSS